MHANETAPPGPLAAELTPLEISQAMLESEENPNTARPLTPLEQAASGVAPGRAARRSPLARALCSPSLAWGAAAVAGVGVIAALALAKRAPRRSWRPTVPFRLPG